MEMNVIERSVFWLLLAIALGISGHRIYILFRLIMMGEKTEKLDQLGKRATTVMSYVLGQWSNLKNISLRDLAGFGHLFIFFGVIVFSINYVVFLFIGEGLGVSETIRNSVFAHYFLYGTDIMGLLLLIAIVSAAVRRGILRPARLGPNFDAGIFFALALFIFFLFACYFALEGLSLNLGMNASRAPVARSFAYFFGQINLAHHTQVALFQIIWWLQYILILGFLITGHIHTISTPCLALSTYSSDHFGQLAPFNPLTWIAESVWEYPRLTNSHGSSYSRGLHVLIVGGVRITAQLI